MGETREVLSRGDTDLGEGDVAVVKPYSNYYDVEVGMALADGDGGYEYGISGMVTEEGIDDIKNKQEKVMRQGRRTGRSFGEISFHFISANGKSYQVEVKAGSAGGDSGAPIVYPGYNNNCWVIASHHEHNCVNNDLRGQGTAIHSVEDKLNLKYSPDNPV